MDDTHEIRNRKILGEIMHMEGNKFRIPFVVVENLMINVIIGSESFKPIKINIKKETNDIGINGKTMKTKISNCMYVYGKSQIIKHE
jgi:hypothetical protein